MLTRSSSGARPGTTLVELVVAITLAAIVLATAVSSVLRQQRTARHLAGRAAGGAQAGAISSLLLSDLGDTEPAIGDIVPSEARDTSLQLRASIVTGPSCDSAVGRAVLASGDGDDLAPTGVASAPHAGDSLWWYVDAASSWRARLISDVAGSFAPCLRPRGGQGTMLRLALADADTIPVGALLRVTRPVRYAFYRSGDGSWQLGMREWSDATQRFAAPQPIAGPFAQRRTGTLRTGFRYFDAAGDELLSSATGADVARIARIRVTAVALVPLASHGADSVQVDSADVATQRSRRP